MRVISDRPIRHGGLTATSSGLPKQARGEAAERRPAGPCDDRGNLTGDYRVMSRVELAPLRVGQELARIDDLAHLLVIGLRGAIVDRDGHPPQRVLATWTRRRTTRNAASCPR